MLWEHMLHCYGTTTHLQDVNCGPMTSESLFHNHQPETTEPIINQIIYTQLVHQIQISNKCPCQVLCSVTSSSNRSTLMNLLCSHYTAKKRWVALLNMHAVTAALNVILVSVACLIPQKIFHQQRLVKIIKHRGQSLTSLLWLCLPLDIPVINLIPQIEGGHDVILFIVTTVK